MAMILGIALLSFFLLALLFTLTILLGIAYIGSNLREPARVPIHCHQGARRCLFAYD